MADSKVISKQDYVTAEISDGTLITEVIDGLKAQNPDKKSLVTDDNLVATYRYSDFKDLAHGRTTCKPVFKKGTLEVQGPPEDAKRGSQLIIRDSKTASIVLQFDVPAKTSSLSSIKTNSSNSFLKAKATQMPQLLGMLNAIAAFCG